LVKVVLDVVVRGKHVAGLIIISWLPVATSRDRRVWRLVAFNILRPQFGHLPIGNPLGQLEIALAVLLLLVLLIADHPL
jgi:hypothetical protein